jgi:hypothetical protein
MHPELLTFLDYLDRVHARTRQVVTCIPAEALEWAPAPSRWTAGDQVRHLAGIERWMYAETVFGRSSCYPGHGRELADGLAAVRAYDDGLHAEARAIFAALTPEQWTGRTLTPALWWPPGWPQLRTRGATARDAHAGVVRRCFVCRPLADCPATQEQGMRTLECQLT